MKHTTYLQGDAGYYMGTSEIIHGGTSFTPWVADGHLIVCAGDASALIADCSSASENAEENAAFIVKACNTYAEREELLTAACAALLATNGEPGHTNCPAGVASIIQRIRAL